MPQFHKHPGTHAAARCFTARECLLKKRSPFAKCTTGNPERGEYTCQAQGLLVCLLPFLLFQEPGQTCSQVVVVLFDHLHPYGLLWPRQFWLYAFHEVQVIVCMRLPDRSHLTTVFQAFPGVFADGLQEKETEFSVFLFNGVEQTFFQQRRKVFQKPWRALRTETSGDPFNGRKSVATHEDRAPAKETLLSHRKQVITPIQVGAQCLMPGRSILRPTGWKAQPLVETCQQRLWRKELDTRGY